MNRRTVDALRVNHIRCAFAVVICSLMCILVFIGVTHQLVQDPGPLVQETGQKTFRMFTILSNMLMAITAGMCIPYAVDGLR